MSRPALEVRALNAWQRDLQVLFDIDLVVPEGTVVALIGANGAGKSSLLEALAGLVRASGKVRIGDVELLSLPPARICQAGLALVPEGRRLFPSLTIEENLLIGAGAKRGGPWTLDRVYELFPVLREKRKSPSLSLSGGQQQQAALGRALMSNPRVLLCDELSLGLSPAVVRTIYAQMSSITSAGTAVVLVEQNTALAMAHAQEIHCLREGRIVLSGHPQDLDAGAISAAYFGEKHHA